MPNWQVRKTIANKEAAADSTGTQEVHFQQKVSMLNQKVCRYKICDLIVEGTKEALEGI
ncbi:predicted protein [Botrytis cinerea T4]|uniref:Uncharacterized protein n=1 Tax=Botryotinia fuckeliana (strain T4) TaxID=999810 RepID=G2XQK1_BOTF4|nr:predicted protein [Botrytis cinerea T4]